MPTPRLLLKVYAMIVQKLKFWVSLVCVWLAWQSSAFAVTINGYLPPVRLNGEFSLTDTDGQPYSSERLKGNYSLLLFGFTHCADICPTALNDALQIKEALLGQMPVQIVFITLDPERDTPESLGQYVSAYGGGIVALSGDMNAITQVAQRYRMKFRKQNLKSPGAYTIDHSAFLYLLDKKANPLVFYPYGTVLDDIISDLKLLNQNGQGVVTGKIFNQPGMMDH